MAKALKKMEKTKKKSARAAVIPKASAKSAKPAKKAAKPAKTVARKKTAKIDPLNRTNYRAVTPMLSVRDVQRAMDFYNTAFGFTAVKGQKLAIRIESRALGFPLDPVLKLLGDKDKVLAENDDFNKGRDTEFWALAAALKAAEES